MFSGTLGLIVPQNGKGSARWPRCMWLLKKLFYIIFGKNIIKILIENCFFKTNFNKE